MIRRDKNGKKTSKLNHVSTDNSRIEDLIIEITVSLVKTHEEEIESRSPYPKLLGIRIFPAQGHFGELDCGGARVPSVDCITNAVGAVPASGGSSRGRLHEKTYLI